MKESVQSLILLYLKLLSQIALKLTTPPIIIGIAGSVGKSSTRNAVQALLQDKDTTEVIGNSETGVPLGILGIKPTGYTALDWIKMLLRSPFGLMHLKGVKFLIVEMGVDEPFPPKNMSYLLSLIKPSIGIIVNESAAHTEQFEKLLSTQQKNTLTDHERLEFFNKRNYERRYKDAKKSSLQSRYL